MCAHNLNKKHVCSWCHVNMCSNSSLCYDCLGKRHHHLVMEVRRQAIAGAAVIMLLLLVMPATTN